MYNKGDFHIHSTYSDGKCNPTDIILLSKKKNIDIISITDHNSINSLCESLDIAKKYGIAVIPGVELSTRYNDTRVHILGYFYYNPYKNSNLLIKCLHYIKEHKISSLNKVLEDKLDIKYRSDKISVEKGIEMLRFFKATIILAHPVLLPRNDFENIASLGFDGIEAKYSKNTQKDTAFFINYAKNHNLIYTAGSDFHNINDNYRFHGNIGDVFLDTDEISLFLHFLRDNNS